MKDVLVQGETKSWHLFESQDADNSRNIASQGKMKDGRVHAETNPWRFLESLDADNPGDFDLLKSTRAHELEIVRNLILSSKVTLLYAFSGNGKSSLINAGIIPTFQRSGFGVFRTRPRPAFSLANPSQAIKDCLVLEYWFAATTKRRTSSRKGSARRCRDKANVACQLPSYLHREAQSVILVAAKY